jgi:hypothetical protein
LLVLVAAIQAAVVDRAGRETRPRQLGHGERALVVLVLDEDGGVELAGRPALVGDRPHSLELGTGIDRAVVGRGHDVEILPMDTNVRFPRFEGDGPPSAG